MIADRPAAIPPRAEERIALPPVADKEERNFVRVGEHRLTWADRIVYLVIFAGLVYALFCVGVR